MNKPFKFRYVNEIVGFFVLVTVLLLIVGIFMVGKAHDWFEQKVTIDVRFPSEGSLGVQNGAEVRVLGTTVGRVSKIAVDEHGKMYGKITIKNDFARFVRTDSAAVVKKTGVVFGDTYIELTQGIGKPLALGESLECVRGIDVLEAARVLLAEFHEEALPLLKQVRLTAEQFALLAEDLRNERGHLQQSLRNLEIITASLEKGTGTAGRLIRDPTIAKQLEANMKKTGEAVEAFRLVLKNVQEITTRLPPVINKFDARLDTLPELVSNMQQTMQESQRLIESIEKHWIIRKYVSKPGLGDNIPPSRVRD